MVGVLALRYMYVLALSVWFGGSIVVGLVAAPVSDQTLHRFFLMSYAAGGALLLSLMIMGLLGPRPSGFAARFGVAAIMFVATVFAGRRLHALPPSILSIIGICALALLFWEARDGTRAV
jgi:hypothetical protein